ncbi:MAG: hypothetical protein ACLQFM_02455, partial [Terriglobales bacterium]
SKPPPSASRPPLRVTDQPPTSPSPEPSQAAATKDSLNNFITHAQLAAISPTAALALRRFEQARQIIHNTEIFP